MILCQLCYAAFDRPVDLAPHVPAVYCHACSKLTRVQQLDLYATRTGVTCERRQEQRRHRHEIETIKHPALT